MIASGPYFILLILLGAYHEVLHLRIHAECLSHYSIFNVIHYETSMAKGYEQPNHEGNEQEKKNENDD